MTNYPSGTGPNDPDAPWNDDGPVCHECGDTGLGQCPWCSGDGYTYAGDDDDDEDTCAACRGKGTQDCDDCPTCQGCGERIADGGHRQCHRIP